MSLLPATAEQIEHWNTEELIPYERNARTHSPEQVGKIMASMMEFGFTNPILVAGKGILAGHGRLMAAREIGLKTVPVIRLDHLNDMQQRAYILADNRLALDAGWDEELLATELASLADDGYDLSLTGFSDDELGDLLAGYDEEEPAAPTVTDPDIAPAVPKIPTAQLGDIFRLGNHRVICGDSTNLDQIRQMLDGDEIDCLWTDPPYNVAYESDLAGSIQNDDMDDASFAQFLFDVYSTAYAVMRPGAPAYIAHADTEGTNFRHQFERAGFYLASCLVWRKNSLVLGRADYHWQHEPILYGWKPGAAHTWYGERNKTTIVELAEHSIEQISENEYQIPFGEKTIIVRGDNLELTSASGSVFWENKPQRNAEHPTMKPVGLIVRQLQNSAKRGDKVMDLFGGSGSTLMACETLGMHARLSELDPKFVDVIVKRWQDFTGRNAVHVQTELTFNQLATNRSAPPLGTIKTQIVPNYVSVAANDEVVATKVA